jgi:hypothetical protein
MAGCLERELPFDERPGRRGSLGKPSGRVSNASSATLRYHYAGRRRLFREGPHFGKGGR